MNSAKRFFSLLLVLALMLTCVQLPARAADHVRGTVTAEKTMDEPDTGGQCGDDVYWSLDEEGLLTIYGTGMMWDYPEENPDFVVYHNNIEACVIEEGVTSIGVYAFFGCDNLTRVDVPASVVVVNECAFALCESLAAVYFYGDAPDIGSDAFWGVTAECRYSTACDGWDEVVGNDYEGSLTWIPHDENEPDDEPDDDEWIGSGQCGADVYWSFSEDGLLTISGTGDMWDYSEDDPGWYQYSEQVTECVIEEGVTSIGEFAFYDCPNLEKVTIPGSVTHIGRSAFDGCSLTTLTIPASVESIGQFAFSRCTDLREIHFMGEAPDIAFNAFEGVSADCYYPSGPTWNNETMEYIKGQLNWIIVGDDEASWNVTGQCGDDVYWSLSAKGLLDITGTGAMWDYPEDYPDWIKYTDILVEAVIHDGVTTIGDFAFYECPNIVKVTIPSTVSRIGKSAFYGCYLAELTIPNGVKEIGQAAFKSNRMTSVTIPASVEIIDKYAFATCPNLNEIRFLGGAPEIGEDVFEGVVATCYYPSGSSWSNDMFRHYGGKLTWIAEGGQDESLPGDLNGSGGVDSDDAIYLLYHTLFGDGLYPVSGDCDYDRNGSVDADDAIYLLYYTLFGDALYPLS